MDDFSDNEIQEINLIRVYKIKYPKAELGFVVAMSSLRKTLQLVMISMLLRVLEKNFP
jgi:uncharacterized protein